MPMRLITNRYPVMRKCATIHSWPRWSYSDQRKRSV